MIISTELANVTDANKPTPYPHWMLLENYEQPAIPSATVDHCVKGDGFRADTCASNSIGCPVLRTSLSSRQAAPAAIQVCSPSWLSKTSAALPSTWSTSASTAIGL